MLKNLEVLRNNKIVAIVAMFLLIGTIVWLLDMIHGYSLFKTFEHMTIEEAGMICKEEPGTQKCINALNKAMSS
jgi:hypothetical protein